MSIQVARPILQQAAAEARSILIERAAALLDVPDTDLQVHDGVIVSKTSATKSVPYGALIDGSFMRQLNGEAPLKPPQDYTIVGQSVQRIDIPAKVSGGEAFVQDLRLDGMLHGRVVRPYVRTMDGVGATLLSLDDTDARQVPGLVQVVRNGSFVGVVAEREEQAIKAAQALKLVWSEPETLPDSDQYYTLITVQPTKDVEVVNNGDVDGALGMAVKTLEASYQHPNQAHASIGPSCAVADVRADSATIYSGTQGVSFSATPWRTCLAWAKRRSTSSTRRRQAATATTAPTIVPPTPPCFLRRSEPRCACSGCGKTSSRGNRRVPRCFPTYVVGWTRMVTSWPGTTRSGLPRIPPGRTDRRAICSRDSSSIPRPPRLR